MKLKLHIALVEDNRFHTLLFGQAVAREFPDTTVTAYTTGAGFLAGLEHEEFDLVAVDYRLPDMTGLELLSIINSRIIELPVIIMTAEGSEQTAVEAIRSGAIDYLTKSEDFEKSIPRVIKQAYQRNRLVVRNRRLSNKAREAEKLETITATASTLNHEINNPLMSILGNVELLLADPKLADTPYLEKFKMIEQSALRIREITLQITNLMTPRLRQTPVGPMLSLNESSVYQDDDQIIGPVPNNKTR